MGMYSQFEGDVNKTEKGKMELDPLSKWREEEGEQEKRQEEQNGLNLHNVPALDPILKSSDPENRKLKVGLVGL